VSPRPKWRKQASAPAEVTTRRSGAHWFLGTAPDPLAAVYGSNNYCSRCYTS
jgi:hypothetical protein